MFYCFLQIDEDYLKKYVKWNNLYDIIYEIVPESDGKKT
jgi:hypothetical protein